MNLHDCKNTKVSIIMPVYNSEEWLEKTLISVVNQSFEDYEVIVVDDGSTDCSKKIVENVLNSSKIAYRVVSQKNKGLSSARNTGIKFSKGLYVCFVDSDDVLEKTHISSMYDTAVNYNVDLVCCEYESTTIDNREGSAVLDKAATIISADQFADAMIKRNPPIFVCGLLIKRELIEENNFCFNENLLFGEDSDYLLKLLYCCENVGLTNKDTYKYLSRPGSIMKSITKEQGMVYIDELTKTYRDIIYKVGNKKKVNIAFSREWLGFAHALAINLNFKNYYEICQWLNRRDIYRNLKKLDDSKLRFFSLMFRINPILVFFITKVCHR